MEIATMPMLCTCTDCGRLVDMAALTAHECIPQSPTTTAADPTAMSNGMSTSTSTTTLVNNSNPLSQPAAAPKRMPFLDKYAQKTRPKLSADIVNSSFHNTKNSYSNNNNNNNQISPSYLKPPPSPFKYNDDDDESEIAYLSSPDPEGHRDDHDHTFAAYAAAATNGVSAMKSDDKLDLAEYSSPTSESNHSRKRSDDSDDLFAAYNDSSSVDDFYSNSKDQDPTSDPQLDEILGQLSMSKSENTTNYKKQPQVQQIPQQQQQQQQKQQQKQQRQEPSKFVAPARQQSKTNASTTIKNSSSAPQEKFEKLQSAPRRAASRSCASCAEPLSTSSGTVQRDSQAFCRSCYSLLYLPKCRKCRKPIEGKAIQSGDGKVKGKYHVGCFSCFQCSAPFPNREFYVWEEMPYCEYHYHILANTLCQNVNCGKGIEGPCVTLDDQKSRYHPNCFRCNASDCSRLLSEWHYLLDGLPYCQSHAERMRDDEEENVSKYPASPKTPPIRDRIKKRQTIIQDVSNTTGLSPSRTRTKTRAAARCRDGPTTNYPTRLR